MKNNSFNYEEAVCAINSMQHLIGQNAPKWNSPILDIVPAPTNGDFYRYINVFKKTGSVKNAVKTVKSETFGILLIFRTPKLHGDLVYEWYSFFYS
jgi:hypothetical protein